MPEYYAAAVTHPTVPLTTTACCVEIGARPSHAARRDLYPL